MLSVNSCDKHACRRNKRVTSADPLSAADIMSSEEFQERLRTLSCICGINPETVTKKIPSANPQEVVEATLAKYQEAEALCAGTNQLLLGATMEEILPNLGDGFDALTDMIGYCDSSVYDLQTHLFIDSVVRELNKLVTINFNVDTSFYFGPGAASIYDRSSAELISKLDTREYGLPNVRFSPFDYFSDEAIIPRPFDADAKSRYDGTSSLAFHISEACLGCHIIDDRICQVPKNESINRTIGVGSVVGIAAQHVVGAYIRKCLRKHGLDLNKLARDHKDAAYRGSLGANMATLDFSMASDTISVGLCWALLANSHSSERCKKLFSLLMGCRSDFYVYDGGNPDNQAHIYEKISAMGNSFTFELESLIFTAIARAWSKRLVSEAWRKDSLKLSYEEYVEKWEQSNSGILRHWKGSSFGDDMIIVAPSALMITYQPLFERLLLILGLQLNSEKSFVDASGFRESCGADYLKGRYVRGFYLHTRDVLVSDVIRAWNFFKIFHYMSDEELSSQDFFGPFIKKLRLYRVAVDYSCCSYGSAYMHDLRVPSDVLICDDHSGNYVFREMLPAKEHSHEVKMLHMYFLPSSVRVGRDWRSAIIDRISYYEAMRNTNGNGTSAFQLLSETLNVTMGILPEISYFTVFNRYWTSIDKCLVARNSLDETKNLQYRFTIDLSNY